MPQYLSIAGLRARHGTRFLSKGIVSDVNAPDLDKVAAARAIADAEAMVDSYIGTRNKLPLPGVADLEDPESNPAVPNVLRMLVADLTIYRMAVEADVMTEEKRKRYDAACKWLEQYAASKVSLGIEDAASVPSAIGIHRSGPARVLSRCDTDGLL
jgi:phage gp36-like protein